MAKPIPNEARPEQNLAETIVDGNVKYELIEELLKELSSNTYSSRVEEDVVSHIAKILEILDPNKGDGASIKTLEIQIGKMSKVLQKRGFGNLPSLIEASQRDHAKSISTTIKADTNPICHIGSPQYAVSTPQNKRLMSESRQTTILFTNQLNDYYCDEKKGSIKRLLDDLRVTAAQVCVTAAKLKLVLFINFNEKYAK
ncbi:hypothetical protein Tco_0268962 [Tanacetum coccineum]